MSIVAKKIMMGSGAVGDPVDDEFNRVSFLSHFDGANNGVNNAFDDGSASNHTITANGNVTQGSFGPFARPDGEFGVSFDGSGNNHLRTTGVLTPASTPTTIECWVFPRTSSVIGLFDGGDGELNILRNYEANKIAKQGQENTGAALSLSVNSWSHLAIVVQSGVIKIYTNGINTSNGSYTGTIANGNTFSIGTINGGSDGKFNGIISNFAAYNTAVYTSNFTPPTAPTTAITATKLLTCQSNRFVDNSAAGRTIALSGAPAVTAFGPFLSSAVYDPANGASSQLGAVNSVEIATGTWAQLGTGDFTWEYWIYPIAVNNYHLGSGTSGQNLSSTFTLGMSNKQLILYYTADGTAAHLLATSGTPVYNLNEWHHLAYVRAGNVHKIYANGILATSETRSGAMANSTGPTIIGQFGTGGAYGYGAEGIYGDVRLVKGTAVYSGSTYTVPTAPLTAISNTELLLNFKNGQAIDSAAQSNMTLHGDANTSTDQAKFGNTSLHLDGTGDFAKTELSTEFGTGDFTIECFYYNSASFANANKYLFDFGSNGLRVQFYNGTIYYFVDANNSVTTTAAGVTHNNWYHLAAVRYNGQMNLYIGGVSRATKNSVTCLLYTSPSPRDQA